MRPSLRSDSLISVSFDWKSSLAGMHVGWICVKHGFAISAPRLCARQIAVTFECLAFVERKNTLLYPPVPWMFTPWAAILYELLTGRPPFRPTHRSTRSSGHSEEPVPVTSLRPTLPQDLATITLKCLEKQPARH